MAIVEHAKYYKRPAVSTEPVHTSCELICIVEGSITVSDGKNKYTVEENGAMLIKSRQRHLVTVSDNTEYKRYLAFINPWELKKHLVQPDLFAALTDISECGILTVHDRAGIASRFETLTDIFSFNSNIYAELGVVLEVLSEFIRPEIINKPPMSHSGRDLTNETREYIEKEYANEIKISELAEKLFVSPGYLTHTFKSETGVSPREYLSHIRCTRAYELIVHTKMKFSDISEATGFCCANDMTRKMREYYGDTPTQIRKKQSGN
ncbi:MAG: AraC family transcriptional regulator [Ruminiclostridium sp.]|nr:AraC family transcriptional regulator [Ruminiclostridium sp.]